MFFLPSVALCVTRNGLLASRDLRPLPIFPATLLRTSSLKRLVFVLHNGRGSRDLSTAQVETLEREAYGTAHFITIGCGA
jgi:hypothetical protein